MIVEYLKTAGTWHVSREVLNMLVNTGDSWSAQCFRVGGETESGPAALRGFYLLNSLLTLLREWTVVSVVVGASGVGRCGSGQSNCLSNQQ